MNRNYQTRWDNSAFFTNSEDPEIATKVESLKQDIAALVEQCHPFTEMASQLPQPADYPQLIKKLESVYWQELRISRVLRNISMFIHSCLSVNARDPKAGTWLPTLQKLGATLQSGLHPVWGLLARVDDEFIELVCRHDTLGELSFKIAQLRETQDQLLPVAQEQLLTGMSVTGLHGWGNLYKNLAGTLQCTVGNQPLGLAAAANLLSDSDRGIREQAWRSINQAWSEHEQTAAAILNNINAWRIEESEKRSSVRKLHYLDKSCHNSKISRDTLETMLNATFQQRHIPQRALKAIAHALGVKKLGPWDLMAPAPAVSNGTGSINFSDAIETISKCFSQFSRPMGEFAREMAERGWIDCEPTENRSTGAYCGAFADPREPRVFITYVGSMRNVATLAHELGHAWHNRVMEHIPDVRTRYPMTLAETASIFAETLVRESLLKNAADDGQRLQILWTEAMSAAQLMLNIPARFEFEKRLVDMRISHSLSPELLKLTMRESWELWYEDTLSEYDEMFWASKLHFSISGFGFYNYPYLFGYLFSLGIYAQREQFGDDFEKRYRDILCDTGSMTAESLVKKHLGRDIRQPEFWLDSISIVEKHLLQFESLVQSTSTQLSTSDSNG